MYAGGCAVCIIFAVSLSTRMHPSRFKKLFCLLVLLCLGLKNVSYAVQPFGLVDDTPVGSSAAAAEEDKSLLEIVADYVDLGLDTGYKDLSIYTIDKQRPASSQYRIFSVERCFKLDAPPTNTAAVTYCKGKDRRFSLPPHHSFLFRLTPF